MLEHLLGDTDDIVMANIAQHDESMDAACPLHVLKELVRSDFHFAGIPDGWRALEIKVGCLERRALTSSFQPLVGHACSSVGPGGPSVPFPHQAGHRLWLSKLGGRLQYTLYCQVWNLSPYMPVATP